jgi:hypothetical protein
LTRMICLANSWRPDGRCVAGIDIGTGKWVRPVPATGDAIPEQRLYLKGRFLSLLDVVEINLTRPKEISRYQRENLVIANWNWAIVGSVQTSDVIQYCDETTPILHNNGDRVPPYALDQLPPEQWNSLQLIRPRNLDFERDSTDQHRWHARFRDRSGCEYLLRLTDPLAARRLDAGNKISPESLLAISLTKPWAPPRVSKPKRCYKLVAAVIEL